MEKTNPPSNINNNSINNNKIINTSTQYDKNKELLSKLLKEKLDIRLIKLEKRHKNHFSIMKQTTEEIKKFSEWAINANKQIKEKQKKEKEKQMSQLKNKSKKKDSIPVSKSSFLKTKTPLRTKSSKSFIFDEAKTDISRNKNMNKSLVNPKISKTMGNRTKSYSILNKERKKSNATNNTNKTINNLNVVGDDVLRRPSVISNKSNKSNKTATISKTPKNKKTIVKTSNKNVTPVRKKTPFKKRNTLDKAESIHSFNNNKNINNNQNKENNTKFENIKKNEQNKKNEEININKMESALQKDDLLNNNDPLLISPITDSDFFSNVKISKINTFKVNSDFTEHEKEHKYIFNLGKNIDFKLYNIIADYLITNDLIQFKNISKYFYKLFKVYIINKLQKEKNFFIDKNKNFSESDIPPKLTIKDFVISKGSTKAFGLLNEPNLNYVFFEEVPANDDILIIYRLYFQFINHPYQYLRLDNKKEFWVKCREYFSREIKGKIGELLQKVVEEKKINIEGNNLYKIYKLANKNLTKIYPSYFSKTCGTTGLFTFFIKDVLDFLGISNDEKIQKKSYWTNKKIIDSLENKINYIKNIKDI